MVMMSSNCPRALHSQRTEIEEKVVAKEWKQTQKKKIVKLAEQKKQIYLAGKVAEKAEKSIKLITTIITKADKKSIQQCACYPFKKRAEIWHQTAPSNKLDDTNLWR